MNRMFGRNTREGRYEDGAEEEEQCDADEEKGAVKSDG
jgi:hypothetical protein